MSYGFKMCSAGVLEGAGKLSGCIMSCEIQGFESESNDKKLKIYTN